MIKKFHKNLKMFVHRNNIFDLALLNFSKANSQKSKQEMSSKYLEQFLSYKAETEQIFAMFKEK